MLSLSLSFPLPFPLSLLQALRCWCFPGSKSDEIVRVLRLDSTNVITEGEGRPGKKGEESGEEEEGGKKGKKRVKREQGEEVDDFIVDDE